MTPRPLLRWREHAAPSGAVVSTTAGILVKPLNKGRSPIGWYYTQYGQRHGPVLEPKLRELITQGGVAPGDLVWRPGWPAWRRADVVEGLFVPPPLPGQRVDDGNQAESQTQFVSAPPSPPAPSPSEPALDASERRHTDGERVQAPQKELPTKWLGFWIWCRLPLGAVIGVVSAFAPTGPTTQRSVLDPADPAAELAHVIGIAVSLVVAVFVVTVAVGLHRRRVWAWRANWILLFGEALLLPADIVTNSVSASQTTLMYFVLLALVLLLWVLPNFVYFRKRRSLFR